MSRISKEGVQERVVGEILDLLKKQGEITPRELDSLLETLAAERGGEGREDIYAVARGLFDMGVIRVVPHAIPIKDKGLILSSKVVVRPREATEKGAVGLPPRTRSKIPHSLKQKLGSVVAQ